jgi:hypothetical protein
METGEVLIEANQELTAPTVTKLHDAGHREVEIFFPERDDAGNVISVTLKKDPVKTQNDALLEIYRKLRPAIRRRWTQPRSSSRACSSMRASTTSRASAA